MPDNPGGGTVSYTNPWGDHDYIDDIETNKKILGLLKDLLEVVPEVNLPENRFLMSITSSMLPPRRTAPTNSAV